MHKNSCVVYVETLGEYRIVPISAIKTIPSVTWMLPTQQQNRHRSDKKRKRSSSNNNNTEQWNEMCKLGYKHSKLNDEETQLDLRYFTKTMHIPDQYREYITLPQYSSSRWSKNEENTGVTNSSNTKNVPAKKPNQNQAQSAAEKPSVKVDNSNKNTIAKRPNPSAEPPKTTGKTTGNDLPNVDYVHYAASQTTHMPYVDRSNTVLFSHMDNVELDGSNMTQGYGK